MPSSFFYDSFYDIKITISETDEDGKFLSTYNGNLSNTSPHYNTISYFPYKLIKHNLHHYVAMQQK